MRSGAAGMARRRKRHFRPDLRLRQHHVYQHRLDAGRYQPLLVQLGRVGLRRPSTSAPTGSPMMAARTTARPESTATATRPTSTKSDMRSVSATRGRTMAALRIRPTRSMPTTPGNIPSCRISRSRIIPGVRTATWYHRCGGHLRRGFDIRRGELNQDRRYRLWLQQQCRRGLQFRQLHFGDAKPNTDNEVELPSGEIVTVTGSESLAAKVASPE